ncbi:MAG: type II toxin-antitoxin system Phd/YefM family antitoxin [Planctomycetota bacterium]|jgi:antitoxin (DNA-binding transcriptional repressor) of toxin-antitoxin stability system
MKRIPLHVLKQHLSALVAEAEGGTSFLITRHKRIVAQLMPADAHLHVGSRLGKGKLKPLLRSRTKGRYLDVIADDRRGGRGGL